MVQTELQYKFVYLAVKDFMDTEQRRAEEQVTLIVHSNLFLGTKLVPGTPSG